MFPIWKSAGLFVLLILALPLRAEPPPLAQRLSDGLTTDATAALDDYLHRQGWPQTQADYQVWLSPAVAHLPDCRQAVRYQAGGSIASPGGGAPIWWSVPSRPGNSGPGWR